MKCFFLAAKTKHSLVILRLCQPKERWIEETRPKTRPCVAYLTVLVTALASQKKQGKTTLRRY